MTRVLTRTNFHSSKLIRTLVDLSVLETAESMVAFGEKLGGWIDFADAIALSGVHSAVAGDLQAQAQTAAGDSLGQEFARALARLESTIKKSGSPDAGRSRRELTLPQLEGPLEDANVYAPFRRYHLAHQRDMESSVRALRATVRDGVANGSPKLRQLAALDAAFEGILCEREARLLSTIPSLLEKRFNHLRKLQLHKPHSLPSTDGRPDQWMTHAVWLARFCSELQAVLLAELDLRLQPALGLLAALHNEKTPQHV